MGGPLSSHGLVVFDALCAAATTLEQVRDDYVPCSAVWLALTELVLDLDATIDKLIDFPAED